LLWRGYTAFEEFNVQWMANRSLAFANGAALAAKHSRPGHEVIETTTTTIDARDIATRADTCAGPKLRLLTVSRVDPRKGLRVLPAVIERLRDGGLDVSIDIVGPAVGKPGEDERDAIVADAAARGLAAHVRLTGAVPLERLLPMYRDFDAFVLPTLPGEGIPRVLLESMTGGTPIVTTRVAGIPSLITHEVNGLLVDEPAGAKAPALQGSVVALQGSAVAVQGSMVAEVLRRVLTDRPLRQRLIANGYETARGFTLDAQAARMLAQVAARLPVTLRQSTAVPVAAFADRASAGQGS